MHIDSVFYDQTARTLHRREYIIPQRSLVFREPCRAAQEGRLIQTSIITGETMNHLKILPVIILGLILVQITSGVAAWVVRENNRVYIEDRTGERWDVTEAEKAGFIPGRFQYGIGKDAFTPLNDNDFTENPTAASSRDRIIGIAIEGEAHAYSVKRLRRHEIANTTIAGKPIAAGY